MEGEILIIVGLILDCAGALLIASSLLNLVREIKIKETDDEIIFSEPVRIDTGIDRSESFTKHIKGMLPYIPIPKNKKFYTLDRNIRNSKSAVESDLKKQNEAKLGIILLVIGFLSQIVGNILS